MTLVVPLGMAEWLGCDGWDLCRGGVAMHMTAKGVKSLAILQTRQKGQICKMHVWPYSIIGIRTFANNHAAVGKTCGREMHVARMTPSNLVVVSCGFPKEAYTKSSHVFL